MWSFLSNIIKALCVLFVRGVNVGTLMCQHVLPAGRAKPEFNALCAPPPRTRRDVQSRRRQCIRSGASGEV